MQNDSSPESAVKSRPLPRTPLEWLTVFGPGAVIASITLGSGELIFSTRGGALFGYRILFLFVLISVLKWGLVFAMSRHMVLTGVHPYTRMMDLPGPRGWFPLMLIIIASVTTPVWAGFFPAILGNFTSWVTGTEDKLNGAVDYLWGLPFLAAVVTLSFSGGYTALERVQMTIVATMMVCAIVSLILYNPDWLELIKGGIVPQAYAYPDWLPNSPHEQIRKIADDSVWVETTRYVGVIGGAGFDYLAYTAWIREKHWGNAGMGEASPKEMDKIANDVSHPVRSWAWAPCIDCAISFVLVVVFSAVFVASGVIVLGPQHLIPTEENFLEMQSQFLTGIHRWLKPLYIAGAYLTMFGTAYGTFEIGVTVFREIVRAMNPQFAERHYRRLKSIAVAWCAVGAVMVLGWSFAHTVSGGEDTRILLKILTPANLFTGVLSCGLLCFIMPWMDWRFLPRKLRMPIALVGLNVISGAIFLGLGLKGYWDNHDPEGPFFAQRWFSIGGILGVLVVSMVVSALRNNHRSSTS
jgi:hypothetical protein